MRSAAAPAYPSRGRPSAAHALRPLLRPRPAQAAVLLLAAAAAGTLWHLATRSRGEGFPRREADFVRPEELDRRLEELLQTLKKDPQDIRALAESGMLLFQKGKDHYPEAINALEEARRLGALDARLFYYLGVMYQEEGLYPFAVAEYQKFLRHFPEDREVRMLAGKLFYQAGQFEDSLAQYRWLARRMPDDPLLRENEALSLWALKRATEAAAAFEVLASRPDPASWRAHFYLGEMAAAAGERKGALRHYALVPPLEREEVGITPVMVHAAAAANYEKLKLLKPAKEHWEEVLRHDPAHARAKTALKALQAALRKSSRSSKKGR